MDSPSANWVTNKYLKCLLLLLAQLIPWLPYMYYKKPSLSILGHAPYLATTHPTLNADDFKCCTGMQHEWQSIPTCVKSVLFLFYFVSSFLGVFVSSWQVKRCRSLSNFKVRVFKYFVNSLKINILGSIWVTWLCTPLVQCTPLG